MNVSIWIKLKPVVSKSTHWPDDFSTDDSDLASVYKTRLYRLPGWRWGAAGETPPLSKWGASIIRQRFTPTEGTQSLVTAGVIHCVAHQLLLLGTTETSSDLGKTWQRPEKKPFVKCDEELCCVIGMRREKKRLWGCLFFCQLLQFHVVPQGVKLRVGGKSKDHQSV